MTAFPLPRVLVVDDDPAAVELMAQVLADDAEVLCALRGAEALDLAARARPELILLDVGLPDTDGFSVLERLRAEPLTRDIPVIFVTARGDEGAETRGLELGAVDYIAKPLNPAVARMRVRNQLALKRARDQLARQALTDGLTGLANRRRLDEALAQEIARHRRSGAILGLVLLDIDHFKAFNDAYGHLRGDDCLRAVAEAVQASLKRPGDLAARYGGEEFVCVLPELGQAHGAQRVAERIRLAVAALAIPHAASPVADHVTVSLGALACRPQAATTAEGLLAQADRLLYQAKAGGRHRVVWWDAAGEGDLCSAT